MSPKDIQFSAVTQAEWKEASDAELAQALGRNRRTVAKFRAKYAPGTERKRGRPERKEMVVKLTVRVSPTTLTELQHLTQETGETQDAAVASAIHLRWMRSVDRAVKKLTEKKRRAKG